MKNCYPHKDCFFCDYISKTEYDHEIYKKIGTASYTQLCELFPSLYNEKYCEYRNNGDNISFTSIFNIFLSRDQFVFRNGIYDISSKRNKLPYQPVDKCLEKELFIDCQNKIYKNNYSFDDCVPFGCNYVSSIVHSLPFEKGCEFKYFLIQEVVLNKKNCFRYDSEGFSDSDESCSLFKDLVSSSRTYNSAILKYGDIFFISVVVALIASFIVSSIIRCR